MDGNDVLIMSKIVENDDKEHAIEETVKIREHSIVDIHPNTSEERQATGIRKRRRLTSDEKKRRGEDKQQKHERHKAKYVERKEQQQLKIVERERRKMEMEQRRVERKLEEDKKCAERQERERMRQQERLLRSNEKKEKEIIRKGQEDEKRRQEVARRKREETQQMKIKIQAEKFRSFFKPCNRRATITTFGPESSRFLPFELKSGMKMAPIQRRALMTVEDRNQFDISLNNLQTEKSSFLIEMRSRPSQRSSKTIQNLELQILNDNNTKSLRMKTKYLHFHNNNRPPYYGSWRKKSRQVSGRRPFVREPVFNYDIDSDAEWCEEEQVDADVCHSEDEDVVDDIEEEEEDNNDGFFVEHGYLSEGEGESDSETLNEDAEMRRRRLKTKAEAWNCTLRMEKDRRQAKLIPVIIGPCWDYSHYDSFFIQRMRQFKGIRLTLVQ